MAFLTILVKIALYLLIAAGVTSIFYHLKRKQLFAGYIGGFVVAIVGVVIGEFVLGKLLLEPVKIVLEFLTDVAGVNTITGFLGAFAAVYLIVKLNHGKERTKY